MKPFILAILLSLAVVSQAQSDKYAAAMGAALKTRGESKTNEELLIVSARFERIGDAEQTQWLPYYYAALSKVRAAFSSRNDMEKLADEASTIVAKAEALSKDNSEILCVRSMIATAKMLVDPMTRWQTFGKMSDDYLEQAKKADATNPRPYVLKANSLKNTPPNFGGGCATAKPLAEKAIELYATFKPASELNPNWGKEMVDAIVAECK